MKGHGLPFRAGKSEAMGKFSSQGSPKVRTFLLVEDADFIVVSLVEIVLLRNVLIISPH